MVWVKPIGVNDKIDTNLSLKLIPTVEQSIASGLLKKGSWIVLYPIAWSIAEQSWLEEWDILHGIYTCETEMLSNTICKWGEENGWQYAWSIDEIMKTIKENAWRQIALHINTNLETDIESEFFWKELGWSIHELEIPDDGKIGSYLSENISINENFKYKYNLPNAVKYWTLETYGHTLLTFKAIWILVRKIFNPETPVERQEAIQQISGPIWVVDFVAQALSGGMMVIFIISAIISINLWVFNLLPIPALDGGRFLFILINGLIIKVFWKKAVSANIEWIIHALFFVLLIALSLIIAYNDVIKIINN